MICEICGERYTLKTNKDMATKANDWADNTVKGACDWECDEERMRRRLRARYGAEFPF